MGLTIGDGMAIVGVVLTIAGSSLAIIWRLIPRTTPNIDREVRIATAAATEAATKATSNALMVSVTHLERLFTDLRDWMERLSAEQTNHGQRISRIEGAAEREREQQRQREPLRHRRRDPEGE